VDPSSLQVGSLDLAITTEGADLETIPQLPHLLAARGQVNLVASLSGPLDRLQLQGDLGLHNAQFGGLDFATLQGPIHWSAAEGAECDLQGNGDRIAFTTGSESQPLRFILQRGDTLAKGNRDGDLLQVDVAQLPLSLLAGLFSSGTGSAGIAGFLQGNLTFNLADGSAQGSTVVDALSFSGIQAKQIAADFAYRDDQLSISQASLQLFDSTYLASGTVTLPPSSPLAQLSLAADQRVPHIDVQISTLSGNLKDIVTAFKWKDWDDITNRGIRPPALGPAAALIPKPISVESKSLFDQLQTYSLRLATTAAVAAAEVEPLLPALASVSGQFNTRITLAGPIDQPAVGFQLEGQNWVAEEFQVDRITAIGSFENGTVQLSPLTLETGERSGTFQGHIGLTEQQGTLQVNDLPIHLLQRFLPPTLQLQGDLDATIALAGNLQDPEATGELNLAQPHINGQALQQASGRFTYDQGRLRLDSTLLATSLEPIRIFGSIPYRLPFAEVESDSDQLDLKLEMQNEGLKLLSLFTDQIAWESGTSQLDLTVQGTLQDPVLQGKLQVADGVLRVKTLPQPITHLQGQVAFNFNQLDVQQLSGQFSQGTLLANGILPINSRGVVSPEAGQSPLSLQFDQVVLDLPKLYTGNLNGSLDIQGMLLQPLIGGHLTLSAGKVDVSPRQTVAGIAKAPPSSEEEAAGWLPQLDGLQLTLGEGTKIVRGTLFEFGASGDLKIFGTPAAVKPAGTIKLNQGRIRLPIAVFRLDRSRANTAVFDLNNGLDPFLDLRLITRATEVYRNPQSLALFDQNQELAGSQQTIDVYATVRGQASELSQSNSGIVELTSSPQRSESEIVALLGGNAVAVISAGTDVAGIAGSALLMNLEDSIGDTFGLDEIRLSPIPQVSTRAPNRYSVGLGLEVAKDLGTDLSISAQRNLTDAFQPTRYSMRYRLNDQTLTRASSDMQGNNTFSIEFETRF
jgi:translocation and assembly module TamB